MKNLKGRPQFFHLNSGKGNFPLVESIILYKVILTFESVDEILKCDHSYESY